MMGKPGILASVIIPVYNRTVELTRAIESVRAQTVRDWEVLVIDDASGPEVEQAARAFADDRIRYHRLEMRSGASGARNVGLRLAKGTYAAMLDSDDEWLPTHLEEKIAFIETEGCDGVFGSYRLDNGAEAVDRISRPLRPGETMGDYILSNGRAATPTQVYKTTCACEIGWDESLVVNEDYDFSIRFAQRFTYLPSPSVTCIVHWKKGEPRTQHVESQLRFIEKHAATIRPTLLYRYLCKQHAQLRAQGASPCHLARFRVAARRCLATMSYADYLSMCRYKGYRFARLFYKSYHAFLRILERTPGFS